MNKTFTLALVAASLCVAAVAARAAPTVDTGTPNGDPLFAYAFDSNEYYAGQVTFSDATRIQSIAAHILAGTAGETFSILLYGESVPHLPGNVLYSATSTFVADGWNGLSGLTGWNVAAGTYWVGLEIGFADTLGTGSGGALLDRGVARPLLQTAFNPGSGYQSVTVPLDFGLQVAAVSAVPEPSAIILMLTGLALVAPIARRRRD